MGSYVFSFWGVFWNKDNDVLMIVLFNRLDIEVSIIISQTSAFISIIKSNQSEAY